MTTSVGAQLRTATFLSVVLDDEDMQSMSLSEATQKFLGLEALFTVGYFYGLTSEPRGFERYGSPRDISDSLSVRRISFNSPLEIVLEINATAGAAFAAIRGILYLVSRWQEIRVTTAQSSYKVAAYRLVRERIERQRLQLHEQDLVGYDVSHVPDEVLAWLPTDGEIKGAGDVLSEIKEVAFGTRESSPQ